MESIEVRDMRGLTLGETMGRLIEFMDNTDGVATLKTVEQWGEEQFTNAEEWVLSEHITLTILWKA